MNVFEDNSALVQIMSLIYQHTGNAVSANRSAMVFRRVQLLMEELKIADYSSFINKVKNDVFVKQKFIDTITTNETYFFRTPKIWEYISKVYLPDWISKNPGKTFNAWSAAASNGSEAHTLAIICEELKSKYPGFKYNIFGTDISQLMISKCNSGTYAGRAIKNFRMTQPLLFEKYMTAHNDLEYHAHSELKSHLSFKVHNLFTPLKSDTKFDLVLLRNVLIYFSKEDQELVLKNISYEIQKNGQLIIGESESLSFMSTPFTQIEPFIYKVGEVSAASQIQSA